MQGLRTASFGAQRRFLFGCKKASILVAYPSAVFSISTVVAKLLRWPLRANFDNLILDCCFAIVSSQLEHDVYVSLRLTASRTTGGALLLHVSIASALHRLYVWVTTIDCYLIMPHQRDSAQDIAHALNELVSSSTPDGQEMQDMVYNESKAVRNLRAFIAEGKIFASILKIPNTIRGRSQHLTGLPRS